MNCFCNDKHRRKDFNCAICKKTENKIMNKVQRVWECRKIILMGCGSLEFICNDCNKSGWPSTYGFSGPTEHINKFTGEKRLVRINNENIL